jgi:hypothetical protein
MGKWGRSIIYYRFLKLFFHLLPRLGNKGEWKYLVDFSFLSVLIVNFSALLSASAATKLRKMT